MAGATPYEINVPDGRLRKLRAKLEVAEFPDELDGAGWNYGAPLADVKRLTAYWKDQFDWKKQEKGINKLPNFQTKVNVDGFDALNVHFVHQKRPGNFLEVAKILPLLGNGGKDFPAFHVVAPSLPSYGFSEGPKKRGFALRQYAETFNKLMLQLGYEHYVTQGGDWGSHITRMIGSMYPKNGKASHINYVDPAETPSFVTQPFLAFKHAITPYSKLEEEFIARSKWFQKEGSGYNQIQSTKPQTLGYGLADSPVALLAWIYEKRHDWSDDYPWTDDEILTWVSIYWFSTAGPAASVRIYYETVHAGVGDIGKYIRGVKLGLAYFPKDLEVPPRAWGRTLGPVVFESEYESGGHFAAHERSEQLVDDLFKMFGKGGGAYGVIEGKEGYQ